MSWFIEIKLKPDRTVLEKNFERHLKDNLSLRDIEMDLGIFGIENVSIHKNILTLKVEKGLFDENDDVDKRDLLKMLQNKVLEYDQSKTNFFIKYNGTNIYFKVKISGVKVKDKKSPVRSPAKRSYRSPAKRSYRSALKKSCKERLKDKIKENMKEWKSGKYSSQKQALAVSYSQIKKMFPNCKRHLKK